jgi:signal transduction histidine kinase
VASGLAAVTVAEVVVAGLLASTVHAGRNPARDVWPDLVFASVWACAGLVAMWRRPTNRCGVLMLAVGLAAPLPYLYWDAALPFTVSQLVSAGIGIAFAVHLFVIFPDGRARSRFERLVVVAAYVDFAVSTVWFHLFWDPNLAGCVSCPRNLMLVRADVRLAMAIGPTTLPLDAAVLISVVVLLIRRWRKGTAPVRRILAPVVWSTSVSVALLVAMLVATSGLGLGPDHPMFGILSVAPTVSGTAIPLAFLVGLLRVRLQRTAVADLIVELNTASAAVQPRNAIARALGDPTVELLFWVPEQRHYVDPAGRPTPLPTDVDGRAVAMLESDGSPLAALVFDPSLLEDRTLVDAVASAARLVLENARLLAMLQAHVVELRASRRRIVAAADAERRIIERNLHDGAQQRLLGIRLVLKLAHARLDDADAAAALIREADAEVASALEELRRLASGIHPAILSEAGLAPALKDLARRSAVPVTVSTRVGRLPASVEAAAYFVAAEALSNVNKHAKARSATIQVRSEDGRIVVEIADDGVGGADAGQGTGLRNLQDRVESLAGTLSMISTDTGTRIRAVIPCG